MALHKTDEFVQFVIITVGYSAVRIPPLWLIKALHPSAVCVQFVCNLS